MKAILNRKEKVVGYFKARVIFDQNKTCVATIHGSDVLSNEGKQIGSYKDGAILDKAGILVAVVQGEYQLYAEGKPHIQIPFSPYSRVIPRMPNVPVIPEVKWSSLTWNDFLKA